MMITKDKALMLALDFIERVWDGWMLADFEPEMYQLIAALKETLAQPEQEPVAWMVYTQEGQSAFVTDNPAQIHPSQRALLLYTSPPAQRTWVGLTEEEQIQVAFACGCMGADWLDFAKAIEAVLKEKNT